jgi:hypothetical protein
MRRLAFLTALVLAATGFVIAAPAVAHDLRPTALQTLRARVRVLHAQVRALTTQRDELWTALSGALGSRARAKAHAIPAPLGVAVAQVRHEAAWAQGSKAARPRGQFIAEAAMDYVVGHVSVGAYGYLELVHREPPGGQHLPPYRENVNTVLATQTGICVHAERSFAAIVASCGFRVRDVGFDFVDPTGAPDSHAAAEVFYDHGWHFFDPTYGQFWTDPAGNVLSINDVRAGQGVEHRDNASFTNVIEDRNAPGGKDTWFETDPATTVIFVRPKSRG